MEGAKQLVTSRGQFPWQQALRRRPPMHNLHHTTNTVMLSALRLFVFLAAILAFSGRVAAFGAGEVPAGNEFKEFVWRHGDIADVLRFLPVSFVTHVGFTQLQRRQIYFGNWLRDFSQVIDTTCLEAVPEPILRAIVSVLALLEFGYATDEFEVTRDRLGVYSHVEHIDNPYGYDNDAKKIDERLRGPVDPKELEIDPNTGMKNYIANSGHGWDTSADYVRRQLRQAVELGRKGRDGDVAAEKEAFIHLGAALHTLEDFSAHSNFVELVLHELGETDVFTFVGDGAKIKTPSWWRSKEVYPLVTGTFGMLDIFHSLLGEADDMAVLQSRGALGNLEEMVDKDMSAGEAAFEQLFQAAMNALAAVQAFTNENDSLAQHLEAARKMFERVKEPGDNGSSPINANMMWQALEPIFYVHDRTKKVLRSGTDEVNMANGNQSSVEPSENPGLSAQTSKLVFEYLGVMIESSVKEFRNALTAAKGRVDEEAAKAHSGAVYEDGSASNPSHSDLSKDHFSNILNRPAGMVATVTTNWATQQIVRCWDGSVDADTAIGEILSILHHPAFPKNKTRVQKYMFDVVRTWWREGSASEQQMIRGMLAKESVKNRGHENKELTMQDLKGKKAGPGVFPGSRPRIVAAAQPKSVLTWVANEASGSVMWILGTARKGMTNPGEAIGDVAGGLQGLVASTAQVTIKTSRWVRDVAGKMWPF